MAKKRHHTTWTTSLPEDSSPLHHLDNFCEEMGNITRAEATRFILIAWAKAREGTFGQMWGFPSGVPAQVNVNMEPPAPKKKPRNQNASSAAQALDLD